MFNDKTIGFLYADELVYVDLPFDIRGANLSDKVVESDCVFLGVANKKVGIIDSVFEMNPVQTVNRINYVLQVLQTPGLTVNIVSPNIDYSKFYDGE